MRSISITDTPIACSDFATFSALAGLVAVSVFGNLSYFGIIGVPPLGWALLGPGLGVALASGIAGGLFARLMIASLTGSPQRLNHWRARWPVRFAAVGGLVVALIGVVTGGITFGAGSESVKQMLAGHDELTPLYTLLKFIATWLTAWCGVPGGIFAPSLSIGAGIGDGIAQLRQLAPGTPIMIAETASSELGGSKPQWIADLFGYVSAQPDVVALVWFHIAKETDWRIDSTAASAEAFEAALAARR